MLAAKLDKDKLLEAGRVSTTQGLQKVGPFPVFKDTKCQSSTSHLPGQAVLCRAGRGLVGHKAVGIQGTARVTEHTEYRLYMEVFFGVLAFQIP